MVGGAGAGRHRERHLGRGSEEDAVAVGREALDVGERADQPFTIAVAHHLLAASLRRSSGLDEAVEHADAAVVGFRGLGARWELAGALADRGTVHRLAGRIEEALVDLREAFGLCRELNERALVTPTAAELARTLGLAGDLTAARAVLDDPFSRVAEQESAAGTSLLLAEAAIALAEHGPRGRSGQVHRRPGTHVVGPDRPERASRRRLVDGIAVRRRGGRRARCSRECARYLERNGWRQASESPSSSAPAEPPNGVVETLRAGGAVSPDRFGLSLPRPIR